MNAEFNAAGSLAIAFALKKPGRVAEDKGMHFAILHNCARPVAVGRNALNAAPLVQDKPPAENSRTGELDKPRFTDVDHKALLQHLPSNPQYSCKAGFTARRAELRSDSEPFCLPIE